MRPILILLGFLTAVFCLAGTIVLAALGSPFMAIASAELAVLLSFISARELDAYRNDKDWHDATRPLSRF